MSNIVYLASLFLISILIGWTICHLFKLNFKSVLERVLYCSGIGFGILGYVVAAIGTVGLLYKGVIYIILLLIVGMCVAVNIYLSGKPCIIPHKIKISFLWEVIKNTVLSLRSKPLYGLLCFFLFCQALIYYIDALSPPTAHDVLAYHYLLPLHYIKNHSIAPIERLAQSFWPQHTECFYALCMVIKGDILANHINYLCGFLILLSMYLFIGSQSLFAALLALSFFFIQPVVSLAIVGSGNEIFFVLYFLLSVYAFLNWTKSHQKSWFVISALMVGFSLCCKHSGIILLFLLSLFLIYVLYFKQRLRLVSILGTTVLFIFIALLIASPWYSRSYWFTGNPVYPLFSRIFNGAGSENIFETGITHDKSFVGLLTLPWILTMKQLPMGSEPGSPYYLALMPGLFFVRSVIRDNRFFLVLGISWIFIFFLSLIQMRYLLSSIALLSIVIGYTIEGIMVKIERTWQRYLFMGLVFFPIVLNILITFDHNYKKIPVALEFQSRHDYLTGRDFYDVFNYINNNLSIDAKIFAPMEWRAYYCEREFTNSCNGVDDAKNVDDVISILKENRISHLLLNVNLIKSTNEVIRKHITAGNAATPFHMKENFLNSPYCIPVFSKDNVFLYELNYHIQLSD